MPGTPRQGLRRGTISLPRIASHIGATASTTSVLTGRTRNSPMITFSSPRTYLPHPESPFEDVALLGLFLGVNLDQHSYWNSPLKPSFSFCLGPVPTRWKISSRRKASRRFVAAPFASEQSQVCCRCGCFCKFAAVFLHSSLCFAKLPLVSLSSACPFGVG